MKTYTEPMPDRLKEWHTTLQAVSLVLFSISIPVIWIILVILSYANKYWYLLALLVSLLIFSKFYFSNFKVWLLKTLKRLKLKQEIHNSRTRGREVYANTYEHTILKNTTCWKKIVILSPSND